jgi:hypothetical protein
MYIINISHNCSGFNYVRERTCLYVHSWPEGLSAEQCIDSGDIMRSEIEKVTSFISTIFTVKNVHQYQTLYHPN